MSDGTRNPLRRVHPHTQVISGTFEFTFMLPNLANSGGSRPRTPKAASLPAKPGPLPPNGTPPPNSPRHASPKSRSDNSSAYALPRTGNGGRNSGFAGTAQTPQSRARAVARTALGDIGGLGNGGEKQFIVRKARCVRRPKPTVGSRRS